MKKILFIVVLIGISISSFGQTRIGGQLGFGTESKLGFGAKAAFSITEKINISPSINYFLGEDIAGVGSMSFTSFNADAQYLFENSEKITFYPFAGLNFTNYSISVLGIKGSTTSFGINLGGGLYYKLSSKITGVAEAKYVLGDFNQAILSTGVLFNI